MDVLQVNKFYHPVVGGIEHVVRQLATELPKRDVKTRVLTAHERGLGQSETIEGVDVTRTSSLGVALSTPIAPTFPVRLRQLSRDADVVHYHLPNPLAVVSHLVARPSAPTVVTYHSDIVRQAKALRAYRPILDRFLRSADRIITTSPRLRDNSQQLRPYREKTYVIPLSIDLDRIDALGESENSLDHEGDVPTILFVGRLNYYKGVEFLFDALAKVEVPARLLVVGDGDRRKDLERRAHSLDIGHRVRFLGTVDEETLHECYTLSSIFVLPSVELSEAFGIVQLEAMAHGLPVINTNLPTGVPWVSVDGKTGVTVPPRDSTALATAIEELLSDSEQRSKYGCAARKRVETKFTQERMIADTVELYQSFRH